MDKITSFRGKNSFLSNMHPVFVTFEGVRYPSVENAFQAAKTLNLEDREVFRVCSSSEAKKEGRKVVLRSDWDSKRIDIMRNLLKDKFSQPKFKEKLLETNDAEIIEGNTWGDTFWGVYKNSGENNLGKLIMSIRSEIKRG